MKYGNYAFTKTSIWNVSSHIWRFWKNVRLVISSENFCYVFIIFIKPKEDQTGYCAVHCAFHCACPKIYLSVRARILKTFHVVSVTLLIRYWLHFKTAIRIKTSVKLLQSILQTNHYSFHSYTLKPSCPSPHSPVNIHYYVWIFKICSKRIHIQILSFRNCRSIFYFNVRSSKHWFLSVLIFQHFTGIISKTVTFAPCMLSYLFYSNQLMHSF